MTQELMDYLDAGLKMEETGESTFFDHSRDVFRIMIHTLAEDLMGCVGNK